MHHNLQKNLKDACLFTDAAKQFVTLSGARDTDASKGG